MNVEWVTVTGFLTLVCAGLSVFGKPEYKTRLQIGACFSGLLCLGFVAGPPFDAYAGAICVFLLLSFALMAYLKG